MNVCLIVSQDDHIPEKSKNNFVTTGSGSSSTT